MNCYYLVLAVEKLNTTYIKNKIPVRKDNLHLDTCTADNLSEYVHMVYNFSVETMVTQGGFLEAKIHTCKNDYTIEDTQCLKNEITPVTPTWCFHMVQITVKFQ